MLRNIYIVLVGLIWVFEVNLKSQEAFNSDQKNEAYESEYYYAFTEATKQMIYQNFPQAINLYQRCLEYNPNSSAIKYQLSVINFRLGKVMEAKEFGKEACSIDKTNRWYLIHLINIYQTTNQLDSAIALKRELIKLEPDNLENQFSLGVLYQIKGDNRGALSVYNTIEDNVGKNNEIYINKYKIYRNTGKEKQALKQLEYAHEQAPDDMNIIGLMAEHYRDMGDRSSAEKYYELLLKNEGNDELAIFSYINYLLKFKQYNEAIDFFISSVNNRDIEKEHIFGYFLNEIENNSIVEENSAFMDTAMNYFYDRNRDDLRVNGLYVDYQIKRGNFLVASAKLKEMLIGNDKNYRIWEQILFAENAMNNTDSVIRYGEKVMELFEYESLPYLYAGIACQQKKDVERSIELLEKGMRFTENKNILVQFYIFLAEAYNETKKNEKSFDYYEKALSIDKTNKMILNNYAYFLALAGKDLEKAEKMSRYTVLSEKKNYVYVDTYAWILYKLKKEDKAKRYIRRALKFGGSKSQEVVEHYNTIWGK